MHLQLQCLQGKNYKVDKDTWKLFQTRYAVKKLTIFFLNFRPVELEGYTIPKNAHVIPHLHAVHMDPELWRNPQDFQPERFLNESHSCIEKPEFFMPFGSGQRMCLGDQLAEKEFFLFFTSLMHCFDLENPSGRDLPSLRGVQGVTNSPSDFSVMCYPRNIAALKNSLIIENNFQDSTNLWSTRTCGWFLKNLRHSKKIFNSTKFSISINGHSWEDLVALFHIFLNHFHVQFFQFFCPQLYYFPLNL